MHFEGKLVCPDGAGCSSLPYHVNVLEAEE